MGLDITAYRQLVLAQGTEAFDDTSELRWQDGWIQLYLHPEWPERADGLLDRHAYRAADSFFFSRWQLLRLQPMA